MKLLIAATLLFATATAHAQDLRFDDDARGGRLNYVSSGETYFEKMVPVDFINIQVPKIEVAGQYYFVEIRSAADFCRQAGLGRLDLATPRTIHKEFIASFNGQTWTVQKYKQQPIVSTISCGPIKQRRQLR